MASTPPQPRASHARGRASIAVATTSEGKAREIRAALTGAPLDAILTLRDIFPGGKIAVCDETGLTFEENAVGKALHYSAFTPHLVVADDSGLEIQYLEAGPGVQSARFGGENISYSEKCRMILRLLEDAPDEARGARFRCVLAAARSGSLQALFSGEVEGVIARAIRGKEGFGYDPIFYVPSLGKTLAEVPLEIKNSLSHRGKALRKLRAYLDAVGR